MAAGSFFSPLDGHDRIGICTRRTQAKQGTVGDPADWYSRLAEQGRYGVFTPYPDLSHLSEDLQRVYRAAVARLLTTASRA